MILTAKPSDQTRQRRHAVCKVLTKLGPERLALLSLLSSLSLYRLGRHLLNQHFLVYVLFVLPLKSTSFSTSRR